MIDPAAFPACPVMRIRYIEGKEGPFIEEHACNEFHQLSAFDKASRSSLQGTDRSTLVYCYLKRLRNMRFMSA
jgi:hypothetical protein